MASVTWTRFADKSATSARELQHEWRELVEHLQHAGPYAAKSLCPWIKLARFGEARSSRGALRHDGNIVHITGVEGDYDAERMQPEEAIEKLEKAQLRAVVYTSPSHTAAAPRWRVLAPLSRPHDPGARSALLARVNGVLGGVLTPESFTLSQSYYYGRVQGQDDYRVLVTFDDPDDGMTVDDADELDELAVGRPQKPVAAAAGSPVDAIAARVEHLGRRLRTGDGRRDLLKSYIGDRSNRGLSADEVRTLLDDVVARFFDPADPIDWSNINQLITDITDADGAQRAQIQETVGGFVAGLGPAAPATGGLPLLDLAEMEAQSANVAWAVKHVVPDDSVGMMFGASGTFKSFIALDMALHIAHGMPWLGRKTKRGAVLYLAAEGGTGLWRRIKAWHQARGHQWHGAPLYVVPVPVMLMSKAQAVVAAAAARGITPVLVVVDTMSQTFDGEENSANEVAAYLRALGARFRALWRCVVLVIHHSGHAATERPRGSSAITSNTDFLMGVFRDESQLLATLTCEKQKDGERFDPVSFELTSHALGRDADGDEIRSLAARHLSPGSEVAAALVRQHAAGRGGRTMQLVELAHNGQSYKSLRHAFYEAMGDAKTDAKQKAFTRAWSEAKNQHLLELVDGVVVLPTPATSVDNSHEEAP